MNSNTNIDKFSQTYYNDTPVNPRTLFSVKNSISSDTRKIQPQDE